MPSLVLYFLTSVEQRGFAVLGIILIRPHPHPCGPGLMEVLLDTSLLQTQIWKLEEAQLNSLILIHLIYIYFFEL